jgi:pyruvate,water dikinase
MGVVVQRFIRGDWSGVTFTANPVTMSQSEVVIDAVAGLGEPLVSGEVNPYEVVVSASSGEVVRRQTPDGARVLPDDLARLVWHRCVDVAETCGFPQDVEWTIANGQFVLLQSRPITTLGGVFYDRYIEPWKDTPDVAEDQTVLWTRGYGDEVWTSPETPLNYGVRCPPGRSAGWFGSYLPMHNDKMEIPAAAAKYFRAAAYANVNVLQRVYEYHPRFAHRRGHQLLPTLDARPDAQRALAVEGTAPAPLAARGRQDPRAYVDLP